MKTALFVSPHLDDAAFSCGGALIELRRSSWRTILCTVFTRSVLNPAGFALACQTDKGLSAEIDYMKLRRAEDLEFARIADTSETLHLNFLEAPHRGYNSAAELFAGIKTGDHIWQDLALEFEKIVAERKPDLIFAPQGIGNHVDHLQTIKALTANRFAAPIAWYRDTPYVIRNPNAQPSDLLPASLKVQTVAISAGALEQKIAGCAAYQTQINFQFGGAQKLAESLREFHRAEAEQSGLEIEFAEVFLTNADKLW